MGHEWNIGSGHRIGTLAGYDMFQFYVPIPCPDHMSQFYVSMLCANSTSQFYVPFYGLCPIPMSYVPFYALCPNHMSLLCPMFYASAEFRDIWGVLFNPEVLGFRVWGFALLLFAHLQVGNSLVYGSFFEVCCVTFEYMS